jgi:hypothetical protein
MAVMSVQPILTSDNKPAVNLSGMQSSSSLQTSKLSKVKMVRPDVILCLNGVAHAFLKNWYNSIYDAILNFEENTGTQHFMTLMEQQSQDKLFRHHIFHELVTSKSKNYTLVRVHCIH